MTACRTLIAILLAGALAACQNATDRQRFSGYVEGDFVLVGADESGRLETLAVKEGDRVARGALLFALETSREDAALAAAKARLDQAEATLGLAKVRLERARKLFKQAVVPRSRLDDARSAFDTANGAASAARADVADARTRLTRRRVMAPVTGTVQEVYFRPGEVVAAGRPVVSLLPPGNLKIRFYVPEPARPAMRLGRIVTVSCDGCGPGLTARVGFISREAEYAPPVIFSREERSRLLFMVEARPIGPARDLPIGQPVTVTLAEPAETLGP